MGGAHLLRGHVVRRDPNQILISHILRPIKRQSRLPRQDLHVPLLRLKLPRQRITRGRLKVHCDTLPLC